MRAGNLVSARLLARKGIVDPTDFTSLLAWKLERGGGIPEEPDTPDVPDEPDVPVEPANPYTWEGVAQNIENGTYKDVYKIGDEVPLDLGSEGVINMQVAAFDADTLADGSGTAAISWVAKELLKTTRRWNPELVSGTEGTGLLGGWEKSELRANLKAFVYPLLPERAKSLIVTVSKFSYGRTSSGLGDFSSKEDIWVPSYREIFGGRLREEVGVQYNSLFTDINTRIKYISGSGTAGEYWTRSRSSDETATTCHVNGLGDSELSQNMIYVCLGFCTGKSK